MTTTVCVTGGSGFLGGHIVKRLLEKGGFAVRATTRNAKKAAFLKGFAGADERLTIVDGCDFDNPDSFDRALEGCNAVIHCASPFFNLQGTRENLVVPAIQGTEIVLNACEKAGVEKVTYTSSSAAIIIDYGQKAAASPTGNHVYTADDWSPQHILEEKKNWYSLSKLLGEKKAWELSKQHSYNLCVLNPSLIWGPQTPGQTHLNTSSEAILSYMDGSRKVIQNGVRCVVDVRDVAEAHIVPIEKDIGWGKRYALFGGAPHFKDTATYIRQALEKSSHPAAKDMLPLVPTEVNADLEPTVMGPPADKPLLYDCSPAEKELGVNFRSVEEMVTTCVEELLNNGFTSTKQYNPFA
jgi:nucleoside-diphosphate-sugar epimerase